MSGEHGRAFVTFGRPIALADYDAESRRSVLDLAHRVKAEIGRQYKVLPTAVLAAAMRPSIERKDLTDRISAILDTLGAIGANLGVTSAADVLASATEPFETRGIIVVEQGRYRVRDRNVLRYYSRSLQHLLSPAGATH